MECKNMFDLSGLANNISSQVIILLVILGLVSLVVAVATKYDATVCLILILIALVLVLKDAEKIGTWLKDLIFKPNAGFIFPIKVGDFDGI